MSSTEIEGWPLAVRELHTYVCMYICVYVHSEPREAQRGPERPREARRRPERPREAQRGPEKPREAQSGPKRPREAYVRSCRWESDGLREALFNLSPSSLLVALTATADMLWVVEQC